jgi:hypothetical protein
MRHRCHFPKRRSDGHCRGHGRDPEQKENDEIEPRFALKSPEIVEQKHGHRRQIECDLTLLKPEPTANDREHNENPRFSSHMAIDIKKIPRPSAGSRAIPLNQFAHPLQPLPPSHPAHLRTIVKIEISAFQ